MKKEKGKTFQKLLQIKKKPVVHKNTKKMDARMEILRNTAINSFRSDEKPTKQLIKARMVELKVREQKQKQLATLHNKILQMHKFLPVFNTDGAEEEDEEDDEDYVIEGEDMDDLDVLDNLDSDDDGSEEEDNDEDEEDNEDEEDDSNGVEDLVDLGDERFVGKANKDTNSQNEDEQEEAIEATEEEWL